MEESADQQQQQGAALAAWMLENNIQEEDLIYRYDEEAQLQSTVGEPWKADPEHFKKVKVSALALLKMVMHAQTGVRPEAKYEVMGMLQGKVDGDTLIVMDTFALPVLGTETRVNAGEQEYAFMFEYAAAMKEAGRQENVMGWYHSHPDYGCWLSGIDVNTQLTNQQLQDPWLAIVIDPVRTAASSRVELGAFRCYPKGHLAHSQPTGYQSIPLEKIEDFGVHANSYYQLEVSYFKSSLDTQLLESLWTKYWVNTLSSSTLASGDEHVSKQVTDISLKLKKCADPGRGMTRPLQYILPSSTSQTEPSPLAKIANDSSTAAIEMSCKMLKEHMKTNLFS